MNTQDGGYLELILGPMFSGKTTRLINLQKQYGICDIFLLCYQSYTRQTI